MTNTTNEPDDWLDKIIDGLYYQFTGDVESQEEVDMQLTREEAHAAITTHLLAAIEEVIGEDEQLDESKGTYSPEYHMYTYGRNALRAEQRLAVLVTSKNKEEA